MQDPEERRVGEGVFALALAAFALFLLYESISLSGFSSLTAPGVLPMAASFVAVCTILGIVVTTFRRPAQRPEEGESRAALFRRTVIPTSMPVVVLAILAYGIALEPLGFLIASAIFLTGLIALLQRGRPLRALLLGVLAAGAIQIVFRYGFEVLLPTGSLWQ